MASLVRKKGFVFHVQEPPPGMGSGHSISQLVLSSFPTQGNPSAVQPPPPPPTQPVQAAFAAAAQPFSTPPQSGRNGQSMKTNNAVQMLMPSPLPPSRPTPIAPVVQSPSLTSPVKEQVQQQQPLPSKGSAIQVLKPGTATAQPPAKLTQPQRQGMVSQPTPVHPVAMFKPVQHAQQATRSLRPQLTAFGRPAVKPFRPAMPRPGQPSPTLFVPTAVPTTQSEHPKPSLFIPAAPAVVRSQQPKPQLFVPAKQSLVPVQRNLVVAVRSMVHTANNKSEQPPPAVFVPATLPATQTEQLGYPRQPFRPAGSKILMSRVPQEPVEGTSSPRIAAVHPAASPGPLINPTGSAGSPMAGGCLDLLVLVYCGTRDVLLCFCGFVAISRMSHSFFSGVSMQRAI